MKALIYKDTDYYEDEIERVLGIFETHEQKENILEAYKNQLISDGNPLLVVGRYLKKVQEIDLHVGVLRK